MLQSVLVPLDGTRFSELALPLAEGIARAAGASVHLAHVHVPLPPDVPVSGHPFSTDGLGLDAFDDRLRQDERSYLDHLTVRISGRTPCVVEGTLLDGDVEPALEEHARKIEADVVILTTHARRGRDLWSYGSVAEALIRKSHLPVLAVPGSPDRSPSEEALDVERILVVLDGSDPAEAILDTARDVALATDARITLLHVLSSPWRGNGGPQSAPEAWDRGMETAETYLESIQDTLRRSGIQVETVIYAHPAPAEAICEIADEIDAGMIAMTTHGQTGVTEDPLGSVAQEVLAHARWPVLVLRPGEAG